MTTTDLDRLFADARSLRGLAASLVSGAGADDLVQEALIVATTRPPADGEPGRPWLRGVMRNLARMSHRERARRQARELAADLERPIAMPDEQLHGMRMQRALCDAVLELPESYRQVIVLHHLEGLSLAAIAKRERVPEGTVRWRHKEALDRLRAALDAKSGGDRKAWLAALAPIARVGVPAPAASTAIAIALGVMFAGGVVALALRGGSQPPASTTAGAGLGSGRPATAAPTPPALPPAPEASRDPASAGAGMPPPPASEPSRAQAFLGAGVLPPPPAHYQLTIVSPTSVAVDLAGGTSGVFVPGYAPKPAARTEHAVGGRVVDARGRAIAGAVVLAGARLDLRWGQLLADAGATTGADGRFRIDRAPDGELALIALTPVGWSPVVVVRDGRDGLELAIPPSGAVAGRVTYGGSGTQATLALSPQGSSHVAFEFDTGADGRFAFPLLAPGHYDVSAWLTRAIAGGSSKRDHADVAITAGSTTTRDFSLGEGVLLAVHAAPPAGRTPSVVDVFLVAGHHAIADHDALHALIARLPKDQHDELLLGGVDAPAPIQFHDRAPGAYTVCAELRFDGTAARAFGCRALELAAAPDVRELDVATTLR